MRTDHLACQGTPQLRTYGRLRNVLACCLFAGDPTDDGGKPRILAQAATAVDVSAGTVTTADPVAAGFAVDDYVQISNADEVEASCTGDATELPAACTGADDGTNTNTACTLNAAEDACNVEGGDCDFSAATTPVCDLDASTDGTDECPAGCTDVQAYTPVTCLAYVGSYKVEVVTTSSLTLSGLDAFFAGPSTPADCLISRDTCTHFLLAEGSCRDGCTPFEYQDPVAETQCTDPLTECRTARRDCAAMAEPMCELQSGRGTSDDLTMGQCEFTAASCTGDANIPDTTNTCQQHFVATGECHADCTYVDQSCSAVNLAACAAVDVYAHDSTDTCTGVADDAGASCDSFVGGVAEGTVTVSAVDVGAGTITTSDDPAAPLFAVGHEIRITGSASSSCASYAGFYEITAAEASCTGTATDGQTVCADNFALQTSTAVADCTGGAGAGCTYGTTVTVSGLDAFQTDPTTPTECSMSRRSDRESCPRGCVFAKNANDQATVASLCNAASTACIFTPDNQLTINVDEEACVAADISSCEVKNNKCHLCDAVFWWYQSFAITASGLT
jgi:hypothetical protein